MSLSIVGLVFGLLADYSKRAKTYTSKADVDRHTAAATFLHAMLEHAPTPAGQEGVAHAIVLCEDDEKRYALFRDYLTGLLIPTQGGRTPAVSDHPSRRSADITWENLATLIDSAKRDQGKLKDLCLKRDGGRCIITQKMDIPFAEKHPEFEKPGDDYDHTEAVHIIPFGINKTHSNQVLAASAKTWEIITMYTGIELQEVNGDEINRLENVMTLSLGMHKSFGAMKIWLEPIEGQPNTYKFRKVGNRYSTIPDGTLITLTNHQPRLPLPDSRYLALHAACAKVAHASGAAEVIETYMRELEDTKVLAQDGSSKTVLELLSTALVEVH